MSLRGKQFGESGLRFEHGNRVHPLVIFGDQPAVKSLRSRVLPASGDMSFVHPRIVIGTIGYGLPDSYGFLVVLGGYVEITEVDRQGGEIVIPPAGPVLLVFAVRFPGGKGLLKSLRRALEIAAIVEHFAAVADPELLVSVASFPGVGLGLLKGCQRLVVVAQPLIARAQVPHSDVIERRGAQSPEQR